VYRGRDGVHLGPVDGQLQGVELNVCSI
jgi:hypothetical protein